MPRSAPGSGTAALNHTSRPLALAQRFGWRLLLLLAAALVTLPLWLRGASCGHDLSFHLENWLEVASQWRAGVVWPRWDTHAAWMAGEPRLLFYPPLSWLLGGLLATLLRATALPQSFTLVALFAAALSLRHFAARWLSPTGAAAAACLYLCNPYTLFVAWERSAYAELLAAAWMPLLLAALLEQQPRAIRIALPLALLWFTNAPAAVVGCYSVLLLGSLRLALTRDRRSRPHVLLAFASGAALAVSLAAFYILPAARERRFVQIEMAVTAGLLPANNFLFGHTGEPFHDQVLHTASVIAVSLLVCATAAAVVLLLRTGSNPYEQARRPVLTPSAVATLLAAFTTVIALLLLPVSAPIWRHGPELAFLQFPWRFLSVLAPCAALLLAMALAPLFSRRIPAGIFILLLALLTGFAADRQLRQPCDDEDAPSAQCDNFRTGTGSEPTDEYTPRDADNDALGRHDPPAWLATAADAQPSAAGSDAASITAQQSSPQHIALTVTTRRPDTWLVVRLRALPGWRISVDGEPAATTETRDDRLPALLLPASGTHRVELTYHWTKDQWAGLAISLLTALGLLCWSLRLRGSEDRSRIIGRA